MFTRVNKVLIGKDVSRTANVAASTTMTALCANIVEGEIVALDVNKKYLTAGSTISDSDTI